MAPALAGAPRPGAARLLRMTADPGSPYYEQLRDLERRFPGWQFWAVPHGNPRTTHVVWCARPWPLINAGSPGELAERIRGAHSVPPDGSPSLASWRSYTARVKRLREFEEAAGAAWRRMRAQPRRRRRKALPPSQAEPPGVA